MTLVFFSAMMRVGVSALMAWVLIRIGHLLNVVERIGLGLIGGSCLMTAVVIYADQRYSTPFDTWAGFLLGAGMVLFFTGFVSRKLKHERNNTATIMRATAHLQARGKL